MASSDKFIDAAKWVGIGALALGGAYVLYRVLKLGEGVGDALGNAWDSAAAKVSAAAEYVRDPSQGRSYGSALDLAERQADPLSPDYRPDWRERDGVTVNQYGDYGYGDPDAVEQSPYGYP